MKGKYFLMNSKNITRIHRQKDLPELPRKKKKNLNSLLMSVKSVSILFINTDVTTKFTWRPHFRGKM